MKVAVVGATGLVGGVMLKVLEENKFPVSELLPCASEKSIGKKVLFCHQPFSVMSVEDAIKQKPGIAIFSAGGNTSKRYAQQFAAVGTYVIDNSSAWRMDINVPLVVPEINAHTLAPEKFIIANPNCSTIQLVMAIAPLHKIFKIKRLVISTYQSVTGTGIKAVQQMQNERNGIKGAMAYPHPIDKNCFPHGGDFLSNGYTSEEMKLVHETHKILEDNTIGITSTVVRIPVEGGHSVAVNVEFEKPYDVQQIHEILKATPGIIIQDDTANNTYPMPLYAQGHNEVFVGRIRRDESIANGLNMWIVADNLRKGAATNAIQIAEILLQKGFVKK